MNTLDWYPWHWKNWRLSEARDRMTATERGIYRELLDACFADGSIPNDPPYLAKLCGCSREVFDAAWPVVGQWFTVRPDGRFYNPQMADIHARQVARYTGLAKRGKKGARKRWNGRAIAKPKPLQVERKKEVLSELDATRPRPLGGGGPVAVTAVVQAVVPDVASTAGRLTIIDGGAAA